MADSKSKLHRTQGGGGHLGIQGGGLQLLVPEQHLDDADVLPVLEQIRGEAVPLMPHAA